MKHSQLSLSYADSDKIWRYMDFAKFESLISRKALFFCRADKLSDKWEGIFPIKMIQKFELDKKQIPSVDGGANTYCEWQMQVEARSHWINCWHANEQESFAMWKIYSGGGGRSIAIQSTVGRLKRSFGPTSERIWIGDVEYIDFRDWEPGNRFFNWDTPNTLKAFFLKWHYFRFENEIRAVINKAYNEDGVKKGIFVDVDLNELIECICLSAACDIDTANQIKDLIGKYGYSFPVKHSDLGVSLYM